MQVAAFLSDLKSLSVCTHEAALNLVSTHKKIPSEENGATSSDTGINEASNVDSDMQRAEELVYLHQHVKLKHLEKGLDSELTESRREVNKIIESLTKDR